MFTSIKNKVVVVTGATKGIGKGVALRFAKEGANVIVVGRSKDIDSLKEQFPDYKLFYFQADVTKEAQLIDLSNYIKTNFGCIDVLCVNAGIYPQKNLDEMLESDWDNVMNTNLKGTFLTVKSTLELLRSADFARIILTSSITGPITGYKGWSHYAATKAGQLGFMRSAALELAKDNITINAVLPGNIVTESLEQLGSSYIDEMAKSVPLKRLGCIDDIANATLFLATKEAGYITGQTLIIDGGQVIPE